MIALMSYVKDEYILLQTIRRC